MSTMTVNKYTVTLKRERKIKYGVNKLLTTSNKCKECLQEITGYYNWHNEKHGMLCLDNANNIIGYHVVSEGTINETHVYPREIATRALLNNAASVILFHNHPANTPRATAADIASTEGAKKALKVLDIRLLDHIILTDNGTVSMAEQGLI